MFKKDSSFLATVDIGSTKICALIGEVGEGGNLRVKGMGTSVSSSVKKSGPENPVELTSSIKRAMLRAERMSGMVAEQCVLSFSAPFVRSEVGEAEMEVDPTRNLQTEDVSQLLDHIAGRLKKPGEKIAHLVPLFFQLDGQDYFSEPVGQRGQILKARVLLVTIAEEIYNQFVKCAARAGIKIMEYVVPALANFKLLGEKLKTKNLLVVDIGGKFTEISYFRQQTLSGYSVLPIGSAHITNDLAFGLDISLQEAERLKILHGQLVEEAQELPEEYLEIDSVEEGGQPRKISKNFLNEIISARVREIFKKVRGEVEKMVFAEKVEEVVLTGGGSLLKGIEDLAEKILGIQTSREKIVFANELVSSPVYNVGVGLVLYGLKKGWLRPVAVPRNFFYQMIGETKRWFQEFF
jgi:cell division protein FtsA